MDTQNSLCNFRPLTKFEKQYLDWCMRVQYAAKRWISGGLSCLFVLVGLGLPVAFYFDNSYYEPAKVIIAYIFSIAVFGLGVFLLKTTWNRKFISDEKASRVAGVLKRKATRIVNPRSGVASETVTYMVGDTKVVFPPGSDILLTPYEEKPIEVMAAIFTISNPLVFFGGKSVYDEIPSAAMILEFYDKINIDQAVAKYGLRPFKSEAFQPLILLPLVFFLACAAFNFIKYFPGEQLLAWTGADYFPFAAILLILAFILAMVGLCMLVDLLWRRLSDPPGSIPYLEKLKG